MATRPETINTALKEHQISLDGWVLKDLVGKLHTWMEMGILRFKLHLPQAPALTIERLRVNTLGHYRLGRNRMGLLDEIAIDINHAMNSEFWRVIGTVVHECLHAWEYHFYDDMKEKQEKLLKATKRNFHTKFFREKAKEIGLIINEHGYTQYQVGNTPFRNMLEENGIIPPEFPKPTIEERVKGQSKLHLYECLCNPPVKVRVGRSEFHAKCMRCNWLFELRK